ncbi:MAG: DUF2244 domain-containing protein [Gammaproteobacteria bacterium]|nr:DUF2244 domain-containing protein [Gammaproteobacteria bacterium]MDH5735293.1 DUF2244 domain-containing protein [Gammaproteobacteria bacterium]
MVTVSINDNGYNGHILLEPNLSLSWKTNTRIFYIICIITFAIAIHFYRLGGWLVLPFSGLELLLISIAVYLFFKRNNHCEVITFTDDKVVIERGKASPEKSWEYPRHWSKIYIHEHGLYDIPKVSIKSHGKEMEMGSFLGYDEKLLLIKILKEVTQKFQLYH